MFSPSANVTFRSLVKLSTTYGFVGSSYGSGDFASNKVHVMNEIYPHSSSEIARKRRELTPTQQTAFEAFGKAVFAEGALTAKTKQIIAVAVAHVTQCPYCIRGHTKAALRAGATQQELMEAIWVAAEMRAGAAYAHSALMITETDESEKLKA
jgi:AhpD family alkylhydroperoxidase